MAYDQAGLESLRDAAMTRLAEALASPKPSYQIDGQRFDWTEYQKFLQSQIDWANSQLQKIGDGPEMEETLVDI